MKDDDLDASFAMHDDLVARRGVEVWIGGEPTFTRADSLDPAWLAAAEGDDKLARAHALATAFADARPGTSVSRVLGRHYPEEAAARFAFGVRWRDDVTAGGTRVAVDAAPTAPPTEVHGDHWLSVTPDPG
ncbi:MAG: transglutaminase family protein, partial [Deltaproteobacteria bacterium]|nr:transglutaminase family protein [Deltaproteobacteria bacterium]